MIGVRAGAEEPLLKLGGYAQPTHPQADRGGIRLIKMVAGQEKTSFRGRDRVCRRLQSGAAAQADDGGRLMATVAGFAKPLPTTWPIIEMDISACKRG